jgi:hypothetical protein
VRWRAWLQLCLNAIQVPFPGKTTKLQARSKNGKIHL